MLRLVRLPVAVIWQGPGSSKREGKFLRVPHKDGTQRMPVDGVA